MIKYIDDWEETRWHDFNFKDILQQYEDASSEHLPEWGSESEIPHNFPELQKKAWQKLEREVDSYNTNRHNDPNPYKNEPEPLPEPDEEQKEEENVNRYEVARERSLNPEKRDAYWKELA